WELVRRDGDYYFWCDLPEAEFRIGSLPESVAVAFYRPTGPPERRTARQPLRYPRDAAFVRLRAR
ncbi:MAG: hypothetical protein ACE5O2_12780, partial [Armatimonadota bacterium]